MNEDFRIARIEVLLYNAVVLLREVYGYSEEDFANWLKKEMGLSKSDYDKLMKGETIC